MPQAPYTPYSTVQPTTEGTRGLGISVPDVPITDTVGRALQGYGKTLEGAGSELFQRAIAMAELENESKASQAKADYIQQAEVLHAKFGAAEGANAGPEALQAHIDELKGLREKIRDGLPTQSA